MTSTRFQPSGLATVLLYSAWAGAIFLGSNFLYMALSAVAGGALGLLILDQFGPGYTGYWLALALGALLIGLSFFLRRRILVLRQRQNEAEAALLLRQLRDGERITRDFFVYVRSFETTRRLRPPMFYSLYLLQRLHANELESYLALSLKRAGLLVALGMPEENMGAARVRTGDETWQSDIEQLLRWAKGVLVIPSDHAGTRWELELLRSEGLLHKCVFVMPPRSRRFDWRLRWEQARAALSGAGFELPSYSKRGMLFTLDREGRICDARVFGLWFRWLQRRSILKMLSRNDGQCPGTKAVDRAKAKSWVLWAYGLWFVTLPGTVSIALFSMFLVLGPVAGTIPQPVKSPPEWSMFPQRWAAAMAIEDSKDPIDVISFTAGRSFSDAERRGLIYKGLRRLPDTEVSRYFVLHSTLLARAERGTCAALVFGSEKEATRTRALMNLTDAEIRALHQLDIRAGLAEVRGKPEVVIPALPESELDDAINDALGPENVARMLRVNADVLPADEDICWVHETLARLVETLAPRYRVLWGRRYAAILSRNIAPK